MKSPHAIPLLLIATAFIGVPNAEALPCLGQVCPVTAISAGGEHTCALLLDGAVACWGYNLYGQAAGYSGATPATAVSVGWGHTCALLSDGSVTCWGYNLYGQAAGYSGATHATAVSAGSHHTCALLSDGTVTCWGADWYGQAAGYSGATPATAVSAGETHTCMLLSSGSVICIGGNAYGQAAGYSGAMPVVAVSAGDRHTCALLLNGTVACWGYNNYGQAAGHTGVPATAVSAGGYHTCALLLGGLVTCWGNNGYGQTTGFPPVPPAPPTGIRSCSTYNASYGSYPGQDLGIVIEYAPPGPAEDEAFCAGTFTGAPCGAGQPGLLVNNAPTCLPCPQGADPDTVAACGAGPLCGTGLSNADPMTGSACGATLCPAGITSPPGPGQSAVVCGEPVSACSLSGGSPGPGWAVGFNGVCVGLPWAVPGAVSPCPSTAAMNVRVYWGTTPGFAPGSTFDVCI